MMQGDKGRFFVSSECNWRRQTLVSAGASLFIEVV